MVPAALPQMLKVSDCRNGLEDGDPLIWIGVLQPQVADRLPFGNDSADGTSADALVPIWIGGKYDGIMRLHVIPPNCNADASEMGKLQSARMVSMTMGAWTL